MNEQAKLLLSGYRANDQDAADPTFAEALAAMRDDPELTQWFAEQQAFDREIGKRLNEVPVPAGLRDRILAGVKVSQPRRWWQRPHLWAIAAVLAILAIVTTVIPTSRPHEVTAWQKHALSVLDQLEAGKTGFNHESNDPANLLAWLHNQSVPSPDRLPTGLASQSTYGCKMWNWNGHQISLMCFQVGHKGGVHLFTIDRAGLADAPPEGKPVFARHGQWFIASWSTGTKSHMLAGEEGEPMLHQLIARRGMPREIALTLPALANQRLELARF